MKISDFFVATRGRSLGHYPVLQLLAVQYQADVFDKNRSLLPLTLKMALIARENNPKNQD